MLPGKLNLPRLLPLVEGMLDTAEGKREGRIWLQAVTDFCFGPNEPARTDLDHAKRSLAQAKDFLVAGRLEKSEQVLRMAFFALQDADGEYSRYQEESIHHGMRLSEGAIGIGAGLFAVGVTGGLALKALPGVMALASQGLGGTLLGWSSLVMGGGSGLTLAGVMKRGVFSWVDGADRMLDPTSMAQDFNTGANLASLQFFSPFALAASQLAPLALVQSAHGASLAFVEGGSPAEIAMTAGVGLLLPYFLRGVSVGRDPVPKKTSVSLDRVPTYQEKPAIPTGWEGHLPLNLWNQVKPPQLAALRVRCLKDFIYEVGWIKGESFQGLKGILIFWQGGVMPPSGGILWRIHGTRGNLMILGEGLRRSHGRSFSLPGQVALKGKFPNQRNPFQAGDLVQYLPQRLKNPKN